LSMGCGGSKPTIDDAASRQIGPSIYLSAPAPAAPEVPPDSTIRSRGTLESRYTQHEQIGKGGFGAVFRCVSLANGRTYAAKTLGQTMSNEKKRRMLAEVSLWEEISRPHHPCILQLLEVIESDKGLWLITELVPKGLFSTLCEGTETFTEQACRLVTLQLASALAHLHLRHHMAHCDVKPDNVLCLHPRVEELGCVKLCDFGFAQRFDAGSSGEFTENCGTLEYYAPELVENLLSLRRGDTKTVSYGYQVDCWALGCIVYELLSGEPPFWAAEDAQQLSKIRAHDLRFPAPIFEQVSKSAQGLIRLLLDPEPTMRMRIDEAFRHPWLTKQDDDASLALMAQSLPAEALRRRRTVSETRRAYMPDGAKKLLQSAGQKIISENRVMAALGALPLLPPITAAGNAAKPPSAPSKVAAILPNYDQATFDPRMI